MNNFIISGSTAPNTSILTPALSGNPNATSTTPVKSERDIRYEYFLNKALGKESFLTPDELNKDSGEIKNHKRAALKDPQPELLPDGTQAEALEAEPLVVPLQEVVVAENSILKKSIYNKLPEMQPEEYQQLKNDIQKNGYDKKYPIWLYKGDILDGWNRQQVCNELNIIPNYEPFKGTDLEAFWFVVRSNNRRDLSPIQRACWAVDSKSTIELLKKEANKRMILGKSDPTQKIEQGKKDKNANTTNAKIANEFGTNRTYVNDVQKLKKDNPEVFEKLKVGDLTLTELKKEEKSRKLEDKRTEDAKQGSAGILIKPEVCLMDYKEFLQTFADDSIDLVFTDPPYSTDVADINAFTESWLPLAIQKTKKSGRMLIFSGAYPIEIQAFLSILLKQTKFIVAPPLIWSYKNTLVKSPKMHHILNYQLIWELYSKVSAPLDTSITGEMFSVMELNAPDAHQGNKFHMWQKPDELAQRLIRHTTKKGDLVVDPFVCTGTFILEANRLKREGKGCDNNQVNLDIAISRGCQLINHIDVPQSTEEDVANSTVIFKADLPSTEQNKTHDSVEYNAKEKSDDLLDIDGDVKKVSEYLGLSTIEESDQLVLQPPKDEHKKPLSEKIILHNSTRRKTKATVHCKD